jgi:hypothetical protein
MAKEDYDNKSTGSEANEEEVVVDMEGELISALEEIDRLIIKNRKKKQLLIQFEKDSKQPDEDFALLKVELEEAKKIEDILKQQLSEKKARCKALEEEVVKTRKELERFQALYHQNLSSIKASEGLATILNQQRNPKLKTVWVMKRDQVVVSQETKNLSSLSNPQTLTTVTLQKQRKKISHQEGMKEKVPEPNL